MFVRDERREHRDDGERVSPVEMPWRIFFFLLLVVVIRAKMKEGRKNVSSEASREKGV